jgi:hypothetical protein
LAYREDAERFHLAHGVWDLYEQPYNPKLPVICVDERPCQLIGDVIIPIPLEPGSPKKEHYEYVPMAKAAYFWAF